MADKIQLIEASIVQQRGQLSREGALVVRTGASTGRSTKERFVVRHPEIETDIEWGNINQPMEPARADEFIRKMNEYLGSRKTPRMNGYVGCFRISVRSVSPWHVAFAQNMFRSRFVDSFRGQIPEDPEIEVLHAPELRASELGIDHPYEKAIVLDLKNRKVVILGTGYAGEIKKSAFTLCNFLLPGYGILPMHASANCLGAGENACVLFGLSGTGKTTLSAHPHRYLIGDDEIAWSDKGLSNLEGGCYAKLIDLDREKEPDIFEASNRFGSILENVALDDKSRDIDFSDGGITENTRGSYSLEALEKVYHQTVEAAPPSCIVFLTADAFGALPAVAKLDEWQARYHFTSGYTAKVAGTEIGVTEPEATFSACFGAPFMPRPAHVYGELLVEKMRKWNVPVWLLNTGWTKGGHEKGERFPISVSRELLAAIQKGGLDELETVEHPVFGFQVPTRIPGIHPEWLACPAGSQVDELARRFAENARMKSGSFPRELVERGGPRANSDGY